MKQYTYEYPRPALTVDIIIFSTEEKEAEVLLIERKNAPHKGAWALPGGFVDMDENLLEAALRELKEETDVDNIPLNQLQAFGDVDRDPRGRTVTIAYYGITPKKPAIKGGDDANRARWFPIKQLPQLAFDHKKILDIAKKKL